ncbi:hypothetical protein CSOJ01_08620 [Colletotrichum sojae]|uniref:Uncharacterized protein n=1 Tax=Colletotrichum sojae TaxID=2175907 RepID=A0A8H6J692_9PEZI|nr:hypothetical protein CSOJ01_08620 [Colletotrichum sojae]
MRERRDQGKPSTEAAAILQQLLYLFIPRSPKTLPLSVRSISEPTAASSLVVYSILGRGRHLEIHHDDPESQTTLLRPRTLARTAGYRQRGRWDDSGPSRVEALHE